MTNANGQSANILDFSFADHVGDFTRHIQSSIPGYDALIERCVGLSRRFIQSNTTVIDIGCSAASLLTRLHAANDEGRPFVKYIGIDSEHAFSDGWNEAKNEGISFEVCDARSYSNYDNISLACSLFTVQFMPPRDKLPLLHQVVDGLVTGGALLIAEKVLASTARLQDALTFPYYDFKIGNGFSPQEILDKERQLRGLMTLWTRSELHAALRKVGFRELEVFWENFPFIAILAVK
jgi:tRNA (cmo5U34)-methyltransferase